MKYELIYGKIISVLEANFQIEFKYRVKSRNKQLTAISQFGKIGTKNENKHLYYKIQNRDRNFLNIFFRTGNKIEIINRMRKMSIRFRALNITIRVNISFSYNSFRKMIVVTEEVYTFSFGHNDVMMAVLNNFDKFSCN